MDFGIFDLFSPALVVQSCTKGKGDDTTRGKGIDAMAFHVLYEDGDGRGQCSPRLWIKIMKVLFPKTWR